MENRYVQVNVKLAPLTVLGARYSILADHFYLARSDRHDEASDIERDLM